MSINYDPNEKLDVRPEIIEEAYEQGKGIIQVICDGRPSINDVDESVDFLAICDFVPRVGETIILEDNKRCIVKGLLYKANTFKNRDGKSIINMMPVVYSVPREPDGQPRKST